MSPTAQLWWPARPSTAAPRDLVEVVDGREAAVALPDETFVPVDATIVGYVEQAVVNGVDLADLEELPS
ncbi:MAG: hypothetical protein R3F17_11650 [Planctomycetota bacterium]